jgi:hypothetical protein
LTSELYTFFLDFDGGTYIAQVKGPLRDAVELWLRTELEKIDALSQTGRMELIESVASDEPAVVDSMKNVWCLSGLANGRLALVHVVKTDNTAAIQNPKSKI